MGTPLRGFDFAFGGGGGGGLTLRFGLSSMLEKTRRFFGFVYFAFEQLRPSQYVRCECPLSPPGPR